MSSTKSFVRNFIRFDKTPKDVAIFIKNPTIEGLHAAIESIRTRPSKKNEDQKRGVFLILLKNILQTRLLEDKQGLLDTLISTNEFNNILTNEEHYGEESYNHFKDAIYEYTRDDNDGRILLLNLILIELCNRQSTPYFFILFFMSIHRDILDINTRNSNGATALMYAVLNDRDDLVGLLTDFEFMLPPDFSIEDTDCSRTALHYATDASISLHILNRLIRKHADVNRQDIVGNTPLHILMYTCSIFPNINKIRPLIQARTNVSIKNALGYTAFDLLLNLCTATGDIENIYRQAIQLFIDAGAYRNTSTDLYAHLVHPIHRDDLIKCIESNHIYNFPIQYVGKRSIDPTISPATAAISPDKPVISPDNAGMYRIYGLYPDRERLIGEMRIKNGFSKDSTQLNEITIRFKDLTEGTWNIFNMGTQTVMPEDTWRLLNRGVMAGGKRTKIETRRRTLRK